jgi:hypothetical protein
MKRVTPRKVTAKEELVASTAVAPQQATAKGELIA